MNQVHLAHSGLEAVDQERYSVCETFEGRRQIAHVDVPKRLDRLVEDRSSVFVADSGVDSAKLEGEEADVFLPLVLEKVELVEEA